MKGKAWLAWTRFGKPGARVQFLGITGTDGKSTTSSMLYHVMKQSGMKVGLISTVYIDVGKGLEDNQTHMTSLDHAVFWKYIQEAEKNGCTHIVVEVSSHALYQYRTWPMKFVGAGCTNITREHLDFHGTMEHYAKSKGELFTRIVSGGVGVLPYEFHYDAQFSKDTDLTIQRFGYTSASQIRVDQIGQAGVLGFTLHLGEKSQAITTGIVGAFNAENMMIAALLASHIGVSFADIASGLASYPGLPGRQELVRTKEGITAMIDFAVTPDGLETLYSSLHDIGFKRVIAVFGATGNRDQGKRPQMGRIAGTHCDITLITEDENYHEDGLTIMKEVEAGILPTGGRYELIQNRTDAIARGLEVAEAGDVVVVTGMANYTTRAMNEGSIPWNEKEVIETQMKLLRMSIIG